jgi:hypothetical protein
LLSFGRKHWETPSRTLVQVPGPLVFAGQNGQSRDKYGYSRQQWQKQAHYAQQQQDPA